LLDSTKQADARVRRQVMVDTGTYYRDSTYAAAQKMLQEEKNPDIQAAALRALAPYAKTEVRTTLLQYLDSDSYRSVLADAAITAMRVQDDASYVEPLQAALQKKETIFTSGVLSRGLEALGWLARHEEKKEPVREFLIGYVNHPKKRVQLSAIIALGHLDDPKAIAVLDTFTGGAKDSPERAAAERAVASLRDAKKPPVELGNLRSEVIKLQNENRQLRKDLDDLKKKLDVLAAQAERSSKPSKSTAKTPKS
jgi:aminopeptidase N